MYCGFGVSSYLTSSRLGALVEVDGMLFSGRLRVGIAPGTSLLQVGKYNQNWLIMVIFEVSFANMDGFFIDLFPQTCVYLSIPCHKAHPRFASLRR